MRLFTLLTASGLLLTCAVPMLLAQAPSGPPFSAAVAAGDLVYLSGALPLDANGKVVAGDIRVQTARALDNLAGVLQRSGSRMEQVASVTVYLRSAADFAAMNEVYRKYWPKDPPARTTVIANLVVPEALVEIAMVALKDGVERQVVHPSAWIHSPNPYSYAVRSKNTLFLSGLVPRNGKDNTTVTGDIKTQTGAILRNAGEVLAAAGMSMDDVVSARVYITDTALFQDMNAAYREAFTGVPPARATVRCGLTVKDFLVEITLVAVKDAGRQAVGTAAAAPAPGAPRPVLSPGIRVGDRLYLSGMLGNTAANAGDPGAQTKETMARIGRTLEAAGFAWTDVVDSTVYLADLKGFQAMNAAYRGPLAGALPARATIEAGLVAPDGLLEIMMTAVKGEKRYIAK
jgi:reactive intermediate/imine deaminase